MEANYFELYLRQFLSESFPQLLVGEGASEMITTRTDAATSVFEKARLSGMDVSQSQTLGLDELTAGLSFSSFSFLQDLVENEFASDYQKLLTGNQLQGFLIKACGLLEEQINVHQTATGYAQRKQYGVLVNEVEKLLEHNGI